MSISLKEKAFRDKNFKYWGWFPHSAQKRALELYDNSRFTVLCMGRRWGKTELAVKLANIEMLKPGARVGLVGPQFRDGERLFKGIWKDLVVKSGFTPIAGSSFAKHTLILPWDAELHTISADSITSATSSRGLGDAHTLLILDEAGKMHPAAWTDYLRASLSDKRGRALFISSPYGYNYLYDLFVLGQDDPDGIWKSMQSPTWENDAVFSGKDDPEIIEYRKNNSKESYQQNMGAQFTSMSGRVFSDFSREKNVFDLKYDPNLPLYISLDFGYNFPFAIFCQTLRENSRETVRVIDEIRGNKLTDEQFFNQIEAKIKSKGYTVKAWVGDSSGSNAQSQTGIGPITYARRRGIHVQVKTDKISKSIAAGIDHIRKFVCNAEEEVSLYVDSSCKELIKNFEGYVYAQDNKGTPKDTPLKDNINDHGIDCLRYLMVWKYPLRKRTGLPAYSSR